MSNSSPQIIKIKPVNLFANQKKITNAILKSDAMFQIIKASRQSGKTLIATQLLSFWVINNPRVICLYVAPTYTLATEVFRKISEGLGTFGCIANENKTSKELTFYNGSRLLFRSAESAQASIRGLSVDYMVIDEASYIQENTFNSDIRPTLRVKGKKCLVISTPRGSNWFKKMFYLGLDENEPHYQSYLLHYTDNELCNMTEVEDAKKVLPDKIYLQEYEGEFIEDGGEVFSNINAILNQWPSGKEYYAGLDLGRKDSTVLTILNEKLEVAYILKTQNQSWKVMIEQVLVTLKKYNPFCNIEINGIGDPIYDTVKRVYHKLNPIYTSNESKQDMIEDLILAFHDNKLAIPSAELFPELKNQLEIFQYEYLPKSRKIRYAAPPGFHDDCVVSLALAYNAFKYRTKNKIRFTVI